MDRQTRVFSVGDYIGDKWDQSWRVEKVSENSYTISNDLENISKEVSKEKNPNKYRKEGNYSEEYFLLRPKDHADVVNFPIGSNWRCAKESGLNDPEKDTVTIAHYAYSEGVFWVCNSNKQAMLFIADAENLQPVDEWMDGHCAPA